MTMWGYTLSSEEHGPAALVRAARTAEDVGFDFLTISDHFHPWTTTQGNAPFVWTVLGAVAAATKAIPIGSGVTCPIVRTHPAIVAHASATAATMLEQCGEGEGAAPAHGRFFLGVGTGEALNEHVTGAPWPAIEIRRDMLAEAVEVIRRLWTGETVDHWGPHYTVENARLFTTPEVAPKVIVSAFGPDAAELAARIGDGIWTTSPSAELLETWRAAGGSGTSIAQATCCWAPDRDTAVETAHRVWPNVGIPGQLSQDLPTWTHFEQVARLVTPAMVAEAIPCGPDVEAIVASLRRYEEAGFAQVHVHQIGPDQDAFLRLWADEIRPALGDVQRSTASANGAG